MEKLRWGDWVRSRIQFLGFRSYTGFSMKIGCSGTHLWSLLKMEEAPKSMRGGLDLALCQELRTDAFTLFTNYRNVTPEDSPILGSPCRPAPPAPPVPQGAHQPIAA